MEMTLRDFLSLKEATRDALTEIALTETRSATSLGGLDKLDTPYLGERICLAEEAVETRST